MRDAGYLRLQAEHYLQLAEQNNWSWEASTLRMIAAECIADAEKLEFGNPSIVPALPDKTEANH
jgi:hypothetical protein